MHAHLSEIQISLASGVSFQPPHCHPTGMLAQLTGGALEAGDSIQQCPLCPAGSKTEVKLGARALPGICPPSNSPAGVSNPEAQPLPASWEQSRGSRDSGTQVWHLQQCSLRRPGWKNNSTESRARGLALTLCTCPAGCLGPPGPQAQWPKPRLQPGGCGGHVPSPASPVKWGRWE